MRDHHLSKEEVIEIAISMLDKSLLSEIETIDAKHQHEGMYRFNNRSGWLEKIFYKDNGMDPNCTFVEVYENPTESYFFPVM